MRVANPADLSSDVDRPQRAEPPGPGLDAQKPRQLAAVGPRRRLEDGVGADRAADLEVEVWQAVAGVGQHLGEHGDDTVLVLGQPRVRVVDQRRVDGAQVVVHSHEVGSNRCDEATRLRMLVDALDDLDHRQRERQQCRHLVADPPDKARRVLQPVPGLVGQVPVGRILAEEVCLEAFEEAHPREHVPVSDGDSVAGRQNEYQTRMLVLRQ